MRGLIKEKIENHILKHFYGFEILITPYVISHLKITDLLKRWHYNFKDTDRIQVYLTNTLEPTEVHGLIPFLREITEESRIANQIKTKKPILVVMGNPPYAGMSANKGKWINNLLKKGYSRSDGSKDDGYYTVDSKPLGEKNPKWLQDDYVKFIRFAQWKIDKSGEGIVGFITNHSYLDNPTFRGMRESLLDSFDRIYILNLHGNALKKEKCPDGSKDENVFDIRQGVSIVLFVKNSKFKDKKVFYADLYGVREEKYLWLDRHIINNVKWQEIKPISPYYFFIPKDISLLEEYEKFWKITDIMPVNVLGFQTHRDHFAIDYNENVLHNRISDLRGNEYTDDEIRNIYNLKDSPGWKLSIARQQLRNDKDWQQHFIRCLYRPFDWRSCYFSTVVMDRPRRELINNVAKKDNLCFGIGRQVFQGPFRHSIVSSEPIEANATQPANGCAVFPLYLYPTKSKEERRRPNINPELFRKLCDLFEEEPAPEEIFYYIYAILHSLKYRNRYAEFLRRDFPRIKFVVDYDKFKQLSNLGKELADLHLMKKMD